MAFMLSLVFKCADCLIPIPVKGISACGLFSLINQNYAVIFGISELYIGGSAASHCFLIIIK